MAQRRWLITGGLGFIGSAFVRMVLADRTDVSVVVLDAMTYAGNPANLATVAGDSRYSFVRGDIADSAAVDRAIGDGVDSIVNFAAETHVDRSILDPDTFIRTNIVGTHVLLESVRRHGIKRYVQVSTDEVYGDIDSGSSTEADAIRPRSPYAAAKAGADLQVLAYATTFGTPTLITRGSNTYGPHQYPEKLIPLFITNLFDGETVPVYGDGLQVRDWLHVDDHARGILHVLEHGTAGEIYNLGGDNGQANLSVVRRLLDLIGCDETRLRHVKDRAGHDRRYALDSAKAHALGWRPQMDFVQGLAATVDWYREHEGWWRSIKTGDFRSYYQRQYAER
jgi:dTDP-glucose 4,6-dehydratase